MTKKELMIKAHQMTKEIRAEYPTVDYKFQLGLCMSYLLNEGGKEEMTIEEKLIDLGYKVWKKADKKRIYINDVDGLAKKLNVELSLGGILKKCDLYFDCITGTFFYSTTSSRKASLMLVLNAIAA